MLQHRSSSLPSLCARTVWLGGRKAISHFRALNTSSFSFLIYGREGEAKNWGSALLSLGPVGSARMQGEELDSVMLAGPFQLGTLCDPVAANGAAVPVLGTRDAAGCGPGEGFSIRLTCGFAKGPGRERRAGASAAVV